MPLFATLVSALMGNITALWLAVQSANQALRLMAIGILAAAYILCVTAYTVFIDPLIGALFSTIYGQLIGFAFPPLSGTVLLGLGGLWGCIVAKRYTEKFITMGLPK